MTEGRGGERSTDEAEAQWQTGARRGDMKVLLPPVFCFSFSKLSAPDMEIVLLVDWALDII